MVRIATSASPDTDSAQQEFVFDKCHTAESKIQKDAVNVCQAINLSTEDVSLLIDTAILMMLNFLVVSNVLMVITLKQDYVN